MREAHPVEQSVGMRYYVSDGDGTGGRLRTEPEDFRVREREAFEAEPVDADPGDYPHLLLRVTLRNWDTNDFASAISDRLSISRERVSWAGTKDKRAVTTQLFSIDGVDPDDLPNLSDATVEVVGRTGRPILFGDLAGNAFEVRIRDADDPEAAERVLRELRAFGQGEDVAAVDPDPAGTTVGVPNFFGQQRFGSTRPVTHEVGLAIVREDWEAAAMAYVGNPHERERDRTREAREFVAETRDWTAALDRFPDYLGYERAILHRLAEGAAGEEDFREALETLPTNLQSLFVNAAQSYVFNRICSERLERGLPFAEPVVGDAVCFTDRSAPGDLVVPDPDRTQRVTADRLDTVRRHCERGRAFVTAPLVGTETDLGEGEPGEIERDVLDDVGVAPADFDLPGEFDSTGTRRAILLRTEVAIGEALSLSFALPKGSYATVVLREFLKCDPADL